MLFLVFGRYELGTRRKRHDRPKRISTNLSFCFVQYIERNTNYVQRFPGGNIRALYRTNGNGCKCGRIRGKLYPELNVSYYIYISQQRIDGVPFGVALVEIRRQSDDVAMFRYQRLQRPRLIRWSLI